jgi:hypothetical protein
LGGEGWGQKRRKKKKAQTALETLGTKGTEGLYVVRSQSGAQDQADPLESKP